MFNFGKFKLYVCGKKKKTNKKKPRKTRMENNFNIVDDYAYLLDEPMNLSDALD